MPNVDRLSVPNLTMIHMRGMIPELLLRPDVFFGERMIEPESLKFPGIIVVIGACIYAATTYVTSGITLKMFAQTPEMAGMGSILGIFGVIFAFFMFIILWWVLSSGAFFIISMIFFSGKGTFKRTLEFAGYGLIPVILGSVISLLISLYYIPFINVPVLTNIQDPAAVTEAMNQLMQDPAFSELRILSSIISIIFLIWSANLWIFGMKHARSVTLKHAAITVLIPVIIFIGVILFLAFSAGQLFGGL